MLVNMVKNKAYKVMFLVLDNTKKTRGSHTRPKTSSKDLLISSNLLPANIISKQVERFEEELLAIRKDSPWWVIQDVSRIVANYLDL